jgi:hypothetical protein
MRILVTGGVLALVVLPGAEATAAPQLEAGVGVGSAAELSGATAVGAPAFVTPRLVLLSNGPQPRGSVAFAGTLALPLTLDAQTIGVQPGIGFLWRPSVDVAFGLGASTIVGLTPVDFAVAEVALEVRYYLTVGIALFAQFAGDLVLAEDLGYLVGGMGGVLVDLDLAGAGS